ncbi:NnrS family protein [Microbulbifer marinus]|uniref:Uncharacterized protein involved in response to NO n=1 Tax=Microbulbifer marinus TaxID=658218 RepID=A0A1H4B962_9GAMM|nr:NnrS family protein [Microbulbifer marinus]SEA44765.1 Uncharacterized protein involved in response to NO [Microbulbifer marinus]
MLRYPTQKLFFTSATVLAIVGPWLLLLTLTGQLGLQFTVATHAKSMLFGFVGALIAGYLAGRQSLAALLLLYGTWILGRVLEVVSGESLAAAIAYSTFGAFLAILIVPKFRAAKQWRNKTMMPLIAVIGCFPFASETIPRLTDSVKLANTSFVLMISALMFFIGGRVIIPSLTRGYADTGLALTHRVQPHLEATVLALLFGAILASVFSAAAPWIALPSVAAALLILVRLYRWQPHKLSIRYSSLWALITGYVWLALGILAFSLALLIKHPVQPSLHVITIGALGTLSSTIILRFCVTNSEPNSRWHYVPVFLLTGATLARYAKDFLPENSVDLLLVSASLWSLNFAIILVGAVRRSFVNRTSGRPLILQH